MTVDTATQTLAQKQVAGLRALADMIEANPELAVLATYLSHTEIFFAWSKDDVAKIVRTALAHGFTIEKDHFGNTLKVNLVLGPISFTVLGERETVCDKVVTTETVTRTVPDPAALANVPLVQITETVENFTWVCRPLLATEVSAEASA